MDTFIQLFLWIVGFLLILVGVLSIILIPLWVILILIGLIILIFNRDVGWRIIKIGGSMLLVAVLATAVLYIVGVTIDRSALDRDELRGRIEREFNDDSCNKADGDEVFDSDATGFTLDYITYVTWVDNGTTRYTVLSPGTWDFLRTIHAGKASGYKGSDCSTAVVRSIVGNKPWASSAVVNKFFKKR